MGRERERKGEKGREERKWERWMTVQMFVPYFEDKKLATLSSTYVTLVRILNAVSVYVP